jgi:hypothetical protein
MRMPSVKTAPFVVYGTASGVVWVGRPGGDQREAEDEAKRQVRAKPNEDFFVLAPVACAVSLTLVSIEPVEIEQRQAPKTGEVVKLTSKKERGRQD